MNQDPLKHLRIASPCPVSWKEMTGDDRVRFCSLCNLHVYNIAAMTEKEATALITSTEGRICGRIHRRADGTIITKDCPVGLRAIRRRVARVTGAAFATIVALSSAVLGQKPNKKEDPSCTQQVTISKKNSESDAGAITGTVFDPLGSLVVGARISVRNLKSLKPLEVTTNDEGRFRVVVPEVGDYEVIVESPGFVKLEVAQLTMAPKESVTLTLVITPHEALTGVILISPMVEPAQPGMTRTITRDIMQRLPIP